MNEQEVFAMNKLIIKRPPRMNYFGTETVNSICTNISFSGKDIKTVLVTSCVASEGKSTMAMRLLLSNAKRGKRTLLVDLDLRASAAAGEFGYTTTGKAYGMAHYLSGKKGLSDVLYETDIPNAYIIPIGRIVTDPLKLIKSDAFTVLFKELRNYFDMIIVDTPPVGIVIDPVDIASVCDGSVIVIEYGKRHRREIQDAVRQMERSGTPVLGCIIDKVDPKSISEKRYYNSRYYYYDKGEKYGETKE